MILEKLIVGLFLFNSLSTGVIERDDTPIKKINKELVYREIVDQNILFPEIVLRQAILETGWFSSYNCRERNNIFGFWDSANKRQMSFETWHDCVYYYKRWQDRNYKGGDYYLFLEKIGYAEDKSYTKKLRGIKL